MSESELVPLARFINSLPNKQLSLCGSGASPSLVLMLENNRCDGKRFVAYRQFTEDVFLQCLRQAHQDAYEAVEVTGLVDYIITRIKSAVYEYWTKSRVLLRKCIRQRSVAFKDLRELLTDLISSRPSIRPDIRCTAIPHVKDQADIVSNSYILSLIFVVCWLLSVVFLFPYRLW